MHVNANHTIAHAFLKQSMGIENYTSATILNNIKKGCAKNLELYYSRRWLEFENLVTATLVEI